MAGTRQGGFLLERCPELPNARKSGVRYRLQQIVPAGDRGQASASSASPATSDNIEDNSTVSDQAGSADDSQGIREASAGIREASAPLTTRPKPRKIKDLAIDAMDNADEADDLGKPWPREKVSGSTIPPQSQPVPTMT
jgi:hypothetical protein